ncbi:MAG: DUF421 domain-containing protein [Oscillospiraceae bacterium]
MMIVFFRAIILYIVIIFCIRLMGKKQLGELQPSELVVTILLSNIATLPIEDINIPVVMGLIPILTIVSLDVIFSHLTLCSRKLRKVICGSPKIIISNGRLDQTTLKKLRFTIDDLFEALRGQGVFDIADVQLAVVETTGQISVYVKPEKQPLTPRDMNIPASPADPPVLVIDDGEIVEEALQSIGAGKDWVYGVLKKENCRLEKAFIMTADSERKYTLIRKEI